MGGCTGFFNSFKTSKTPQEPKLSSQEKYRRENPDLDDPSARYEEMTEQARLSRVQHGRSRAGEPASELLPQQPRFHHQPHAARPSRPPAHQIYPEQSGFQPTQTQHAWPTRTTAPRRGARSGRSEAGAPVHRYYRQPAAAEQSAPMGSMRENIVVRRNNNNNNQPNPHPPHQEHYNPQQQSGIVFRKGRDGYDSVGPQANPRPSTRDSVDTNGVSPITPTGPGLGDSGASTPLLSRQWDGGAEDAGAAARLAPRTRGQETEMGGMRTRF